MQDMEILNQEDCFLPLLELPDVVLANVLQRCPPGSIAGFPLPLALAQARVTGSVDPHWLRPLLRLAARSPAVLQRLSQYLRSVELVSGGIEGMDSLLPRLIHLERLMTVARTIPSSFLADLPTGLTRLAVFTGGLEDGRPGALPASLLRLTLLEILDLGHWGASWDAEGVTLPRLQRLRCLGKLPSGLDLLAPNLEVLEAANGPGLVALVPGSVTKLRLWGYVRGPVSPLAALTGLCELALPTDTDPAELPVLLEALRALTRLEIPDFVTVDAKLAEALEAANPSLGLRFSGVEVDSRSTPGLLQALFSRALEVDLLDADHRLPWAALTRLARLELRIATGHDASCIQPLSQLPELRDLAITLAGQAPPDLGALTQCTCLHLIDLPGSADLSCLKKLTRTETCSCFGLPVDCLAALPDSLTKLDLSRVQPASTSMPLGAALQHLTALEHLTVQWPEGEEDRVCDLSPLRRLTSLKLDSVPCPLIRLGPLPCLRSMDLWACRALGDIFLQQLGDLPSMRHLRMEGNTVGPEPLTDASLVPLLSLSLLEVLELPRDLGRITPGGIRRLLDDLPLLDRLTAHGIDQGPLQDPAWAELVQKAGDRLDAGRG